MSYTPHTWRSAELVTAAKLNAIEQGVAEVASSYTPHTWQNNEQITAEKMNNIEQAIASVEGGGSSDFSTAEVTITNNAGDEETAVEMSLVCVDDDQMQTSTAVDKGYSSNITAVLYKGNTYCYPYGDVLYSYTVTGDAEVYADPDTGDEYGVIITGDCTITITDAST